MIDAQFALSGASWGSFTRWQILLVKRLILPVQKGLENLDTTAAPWVPPR